MKKLILAFTIIAAVFLLLGADIRRNDSSIAQATLPKKKCIGYTIIEFGKGLNCNGDTVRLVRRNGIQVLAQ